MRNRLNGLNKRHINEIPEEIRKKVIELYQSAKIYQAISNTLGFQQSIQLRAIISKWRKLGTVYLPRNGQPSKIPPRVHWGLLQEVIKNPDEHQRNCRPWSPQFLIPPLEHDWAKNGIRGRFVTANQEAPLTFHKRKETTLMTPKPFRIMFCGLMSWKWNVSEDASLVTSGVNLTQYSTKGALDQHGGGNVMVWGYFASSGHG